MVLHITRALVFSETLDAQRGGGSSDGLASAVASDAAAAAGMPGGGGIADATRGGVAAPRSPAGD